MPPLQINWSFIKARRGLRRATALDLGMMTGVRLLAVIIVEILFNLVATCCMSLLIRLANLHRVFVRRVLIAPPLTIECGCISLIPCNRVVCVVRVLRDTLTLGVRVLLRNLFCVDIILRPADALKLIIM